MSYIMAMVIAFWYSDSRILLVMPVVLYIHFSHVMGLCLSRWFRYISILNHICLMILYVYFSYEFHKENKYVPVWSLAVPLIMHISLVWLMVCYFLQYRGVGKLDRNSMAKSTAVERLEIYYDETEKGIVGVIEKAYSRTSEVVKECWGVDYKDMIPFYVSKQCPEIKGVFDGMRWYNCLKYFYNLLFVVPVSIISFLRILMLSSAVVLEDRDCKPLVWMKPWDMIESDQVVFTATFFDGDFTERENNIEYITCHEIVHVNLKYLKLPQWLNEGLAMVTVDSYFGRNIIKESTINTLQALFLKKAAMKRKRGSETFIYSEYIPWYWITRFLIEEYPELIEDFIRNKQSDKNIEKKIADRLGIRRKVFWQELGELVHFHYNRKFGGSIE